MNKQAVITVLITALTSEHRGSTGGQTPCEHDFGDFQKSRESFGGLAINSYLCIIKTQ
jgi:hypothetical protein